MDCQEFTKDLLKQEIENDRKILIIAFRDRVADMIAELRSSGEQRFIFMGFNERILAGHYDCAVIDGGSPMINPYAVFEYQYPYLKNNVEQFYILK